MDHSANTGSHGRRLLYLECGSPGSRLLQFRVWSLPSARAYSATKVVKEERGELEVLAVTISSLFSDIITSTVSLTETELTDQDPRGGDQRVSLTRY